MILMGTSDYGKSHPRYKQYKQAYDIIEGARALKNDINVELFRRNFKSNY